MADEGTTVSNHPLPTYDVAVDRINGLEYQRVKLDLGADGLLDPVVGSLPITEELIQATEEAHGTIQGTSLTSSFQSVLSVTGTITEYIIANSTNYPIEVSRDGGTTSVHRLDQQGVAVSLEGAKLIDPDFQIKHSGTLPTIGEVSIYVTRTA